MKLKRKYSNSVFILKKREWKDFRKKIKEEMNRAFDFTRLVQGQPVEHDHAACKAMQEYEAAWESPLRVGPGPNMGHIARKYGTTIQEMKKHRVCYEYSKLKK